MSVPAVGNVMTPPGFEAFSAQGQVLLTWDTTPLATIYYISRSLDGVTYTDIANTTSTSYADTSGTVGVVYYYYVQAGDGTYSSLPTDAIQCLSVNPGQTTTGNLILEAQQRCNKENSTFYTEQELISMCSQSYKELWDILAQKFGDDYFVATPYSYTTGAQTIYPLPVNLKALLGVEVALNPGSIPNTSISISGSNVMNVGLPYIILTLGTTTDNDWIAAGVPCGTKPAVGVTFFALITGGGTGTGTVQPANNSSSWVTLRKFEFIQRNLWNYPNVYTMYGISNMRYRLNGSNLMIMPVPQAGQTIRIWYVPRPNQLVNLTDVVDGVAGWEEYIVTDMCIKMLAKEESDVSVYGAQKMALLKRIEEAAENRDIGEPETVSDSKQRNFSWTDGNDGRGGSGW